MISDPSTRLDHVLIGAASLEEGVAWLEGRTGVRAAIGGSHPGLGTWNALASLGSHAYIEVIAPDPRQPGVDTFYVPDLRHYREPRVATWAMRVEGLDRLIERSLPGLACDVSRSGSRLRPDGTRLSWKLAFPAHVEEGRFDGALPFLIEWDDLATHPGATSAAGLSLLSFSIRHPHAETLRHCLESFGDPDDALRVEASRVAALTLEVISPRGTVVL